MASSNKRKHMDVMKLLMSDYKVEMADDEGTDFYVDFSGPSDTAYEGGQWQVHVVLPREYPYRSPSIGFRNRIYHPNVDFRSGTICLDVINQTWSPMFDLINIFEVFLPQLLRYPNPADPLNNEAAALLLDSPEKYSVKVKEIVRIHATPMKEDKSEDDGKGATASNGVKELTSSMETASKGVSQMHGVMPSTGETSSSSRKEIQITSSPGSSLESSASNLAFASSSRSQPLSSISSSVPTSLAKSNLTDEGLNLNFPDSPSNVHLSNSHSVNEEDDGMSSSESDSVMSGDDGFDLEV